MKGKHDRSVFESGLLYLTWSPPVLHIFLFFVAENKFILPPPAMCVCLSICLSLSSPSPFSLYVCVSSHFLYPLISKIAIVSSITTNTDEQVSGIV